MQIELFPQLGKRNTEIRQILAIEDSRRQKWIQVLLKIKGRMPEIRLHPANPLTTTSDNQNEAQIPTTTDSATK